MKVKLKPSRWANRDAHGDVDHADWKTSEAFFLNPRGVLAHRPRSIVVHMRNGEPTHCSVTYWCMNGCCFEIEAAPDILVADPGERLLCQWCETKAVAAGEKPASTLCGRHVHIGVMKPHRVCCRGNDNN